MKIKKYNIFIESINVDKAYSIINESLDDFTSKETITGEELTKVQTDVLSKYDLPDSDIENIKSKISDAISKKLPQSDIKGKINLK